MYDNICVYSYFSVIKISVSEYKYRVKEVYLLLLKYLIPVYLVHIYDFVKGDDGAEF